VATHVLITVGSFFVGAMIYPAPGIRGLGLASASPFIAVGVGTMAMQDMPPADWRAFILWLGVWMFLELVAALGLVAFTAAVFDRCVGRAAPERGGRRAFAGIGRKCRVAPFGAGF
jgi:hypothetical protein